MLQVNGISLHVEDLGTGRPVVLLRGFPDSSYLWRDQIQFLVKKGFRAIAPDALGIDTADIVGHDWGAAVAWLTATAHPERVDKLVVLSVPHPLAPPTMQQREMAWYQLFFQFEGIAEAWLQHDNWALFRQLTRGDGDIDRYISDLSRPGALTASLNWYRANLAPRMPGPPRELPLVQAPTLGIWSTNDHYLDGERMKMSNRFVKGPWRYEQIDGASHWIPLDACDRLNQLLIEWLG
jgi:pimeloyl-ACP methyl ester carboxylesterase